MPYTPPKPRSPAASHKSSPALSRNQSYDQSQQSLRPELPRSRSQAYIAKHRRSPALGDPNNSQQNGVENSRTPVSFSDGTSTIASAQLSVAGKPLLADNYSQSPVEMGSSDEDERGRSRKIADLTETLKNSSLYIVKRQHSPRRFDDGENPGAPQQTPSAIIVEGASPGLTPEALKIAHSRSNSEMIPLPSSQLLTVETLFSPTDSDEEEGIIMQRMPLLRKKSGELVKPALRASRSSSRKRLQSMSAPGTPSYPKSVHFPENPEIVRHFLKVDKPSAVSADSSPSGEAYDSEAEYPFVAETHKARPTVEWEIKTNFIPDSHERMCQPVRLEQISLSKDMKSLEGVCAVANIAFEKWVTARFTFDYWKTTSEVAAEWSNVRYKNQNDGFDRFAFSIRLSDQSHLQNKTLLLCVRYNSGGQEHWDSNGGQNFQVDFSRKVPQWTSVSSSKGAGGIPRSRNSIKNNIPRPRSFPVGTNDDEFTTNFESPFRLKSNSMLERSQSYMTAQDATAQHHSANRLANRYDFNTSLHTALLTAQTALGDKSGLKVKEAVAPAVAAAPVASASSGGARPVIGSAEYKALLDKFCYFGSPANNSAMVSPHGESAETTNTAIAENEDNSSSESKDSSANSSASNSPPSPKVQLHQPQAQSQSLVDSKASTRNSSPSLRALSSPHLLPFRSSSPALTSTYQDFSHQGLSIQSAKC